MTDHEDYFLCAHCGAELPPDAKFCRHCGASDESGWQTEEDRWDNDGTDDYGEDDDFDYEEFVRCEFPDHAHAAAEAPWTRVVIAVIVVLLCVTLLAWKFFP